MKNTIFIILLLFTTTSVSRAQASRIKIPPPPPDGTNPNRVRPKPKPCTTAAALYNEAQATVDNKDKTNLLETAKAKCPKDYDIRYALGQAYYADLLYDKAIKEFNMAIDVASIYNETQWAYYYRSACWQGKLNYTRALEDINTTLDLEPTNIVFLNQKGIIKYLMGKYEEAQTDFKTALELSTTARDSLIYLGNLADCNFQLEQYTDCIANATEAIAVGKGEEYELGKAVPKIATRGVDYSHLEGVYYYRAKSRIKLVEDNPSYNYLYLRAIFDLGVYLRQKPTDDDAKKLLAEIKPKAPILKTNNCTTANKIRAQELNDKGADEKDINNAITLYNESIAICPYYIPYVNLSANKRRLGQYQEALNYAKIALEYNPEGKEAYAHRGAAQYKLNQFEEALSSFEQVIVIDSTFTDVVDAYVQVMETIKNVTTIKDFEKDLKEHGEKNATATVYRMKFEAGEVHHAIMWLIEGKGYIRVRTEKSQKTVEMSVIKKTTNGLTTLACFQPRYIDGTPAVYNPDNFMMTIDDRGLPIMENIDSEGQRTKVQYEIFVANNNNEEAHGIWRKVWQDFSNNNIIPIKE